MLKKFLNLTDKNTNKKFFKFMYNILNISIR